MELENTARKYALKNAVDYNGKCDIEAVIGKVFSEIEAENPGEVQKTVRNICEEVNSLSLEKQKEKLEEYEFEEKEEENDPLPDLEDAEEGDVVVRFAPNPNGPPHIGSARGMVVNGELKNKYDGKLILRFDDTDPRKKRPLPEVYEMYQEDYEWLGYEVDEVVKSSEQFEKYYKHAEELIEMEKAYVCFCDEEKGRECRSKGIACPHRGKSSEENLDNWEKMKNGDINEGEAVLKIKTDLDHKNPAVRDFVAFRIIEDPDHPITGDKYRVWPLLDFAGAIEDHYTETTHIVRGKDLRASTKRQKFIYNYLDWDYPKVRYWGNVDVSGFDAPMSTSTLREKIEKDELKGWDDVNVPTVRALRKRGFQPEALQDFFLEMGVTENDIDASVETLESINRELIDEESRRFFFVSNPVKIEIENVPSDLEAEIPVHPDKPEMGERKHDLNIENSVLEVYIDESDLNEGLKRLKGLCNVEIKNNSAKYVEGDHNKVLENNGDIIHWVPNKSVEAEVEKPGEPNEEGLVEPNDISEGEVVQFERYGFVRKIESQKFYFTHE
ncbi:MAG: glutamate--tRNA ligase [Candidatus Nanohaloarchaea archaeon]